LVREPADLYTLTVDQLLPLERMGNTLAEKLILQVAERRELPLATFLTALGIRELGRQVASILTNTGFATDNFDEWNEIGRGTLFLLMFIGGCAGSTGLPESRASSWWTGAHRSSRSSSKSPGLASSCRRWPCITTGIRSGS